MNKVAIITGGARGIGATTAKHFAENGAHVVIADILDNLGTTLADSIGGRYIHCDVTKESDVESTIELALKWKGQLDIMLNNAGIPGIAFGIANLDMNKVKQTFSVNLYGYIHGMKYASKAMIKGQKGGSIICISSIATILGGLASHPYTMAKGAINSLVKTTALELGAHGIRVNCISPHGVPSEMLLGSYRLFLGNDVKPEDVSKIVGENASLLYGRSGRMEDVAQAALFLASEDESSFITGHDLVVDGGYTSAVYSLRPISQ